MSQSIKISEKPNKFYLYSSHRFRRLWVKGIHIFSLLFLIYFDFGIYINVILILLFLFYFPQLISQYLPDLIVTKPDYKNNISTSIFYQHTFLPIFSNHVRKEEIEKIVILNKQPQEIHRYSSSDDGRIIIKDITVQIVKKDRTVVSKLNVRIMDERKYDYKYLNNLKKELRVFFEELGLKVEIKKIKK